MSYGFRVWGPTGLLELDETSFTVGVIYSGIVQSGSGQGRSMFIPIAGISSSTHSAVCVPVAAYATNAQNYASIQYTPVVSSGGVTIYFGCPATQTGPLGNSPQRLLVMRYR